jgi:hypothetical protein
MAKSARASSKKANHKKLRARVFGPAEKARAERIHAKLLETIQQPKPERTEMDTAEECEWYILHLNYHALTLIATTEAKEDDLPKGSSVLTASIPRYLSTPPAQDTIQHERTASSEISASTWACAQTSLALTSKETCNAPLTRFRRTGWVRIKG